MTWNRPDIAGKKFHRLTVIGLSDRRWRSGFLWECACDCGATHYARSAFLIAGTVKSCGCWRQQTARNNGASVSTHSMTGTREYMSWTAMLARCGNPNNVGYKHYGGRGISVCEHWRSFENFYSDMGPRPPRTSLDRINVDGNYEPSNCRWATPQQQASNKRGSIAVMYAGKMRTLVEVCSMTKVPPDIARRRIRRGWDIDRAVSIPPLIDGKERLKKNLKRRSRELPEQAHWTA